MKLRSLFILSTFMLSVSAYANCSLTFTGNGNGTNLDILTGTTDVDIGTVDYTCDEMYALDISSQSSDEGYMVNNGKSVAYSISYNPGTSGTNLSPDSSYSGDLVNGAFLTSTGATTGLISTPLRITVVPTPKARAGTYSDVIQIDILTGGPP